MKLTRMLILLIICLLFLSVPSPTGNAYNFTFAFCDQQYDLHILSCVNDPYPDNCKFTADMMHYSCIGSIPATPDFCPTAQQRASGCLVFDPLTDFLNYSDCMNRSGIQFCQ